MARIPNPPPFHEYACYEVYHKKMKRTQVCLVPLREDGSLNRKGKRRTILKSKFLMSIKEGRILGPDEHVDHVDDNKTYDDIDNLQILTPAEHRKKTSEDKKQVIWSIACAHCKEYFDLPRKEVRFKRKHNKEGRIFCSQICVGQFYGNRSK